MTRTKYREERTLVRGLRRLPGEDRDVFKKKIEELRNYFVRFNLDVSELCQWLMSLRPSEREDSEDTRSFWECVLEPEGFVDSQDQARMDWPRLAILEAGMGLNTIDSLSDLSLSESLLDSIRSVAAEERSQTAAKMIARFQELSRPHRMVLAKAAAEFIATRYVRGNENWKRHREEWEKEKADWEKSHPELTEDIRNEYTQIFKKLEITRKNPRVCLWERLSHSKDDCDYAGERFRCGAKWQNHSALCKRYRDFRKSLGRKKGYFVNNVTKYLEIRTKNRRLTRTEALNELWKEVPKAKGWFPKAWEEYLETLGIKEETILQDYGGQLPHCVKFDGNSDCSFNPHTNDCKNYRKLLQELPEDMLALEGPYREWRGKYLAGPRKPSFRYPSSRTLPMPKIFGRDFYEVDFDLSILRLRLDHMPEGEYIDFGLKAWPKKYDFQPDQINITSVHAHFIGTRARAGFRFTVPHKQSRLQISQDEIDELRSRKYPRHAQDQDFLDAIRPCLLASFPYPPEKELRILTVDLGTTSGAAGLFVGKELSKSSPLKTIKLDKLYDARPKPAKKTANAKQKKNRDAEKKKGLGKDHVGIHLEGLAERFSEISKKRLGLIEKREETGDPGIGDYDMRRLTLHVRWMIRDWVRLNASQIISLAEKENADLIVFESMRGFRLPGYDKLDEERKRRLAFFAFGSIRRKVTEKAVERGMRVVTVPYFYSSQVCSQCGKKQENRQAWEKNKRDGKFRCEEQGCGYSGNSDENAARVLGKVFWGDIKLPVEESKCGT